MFKNALQFIRYIVLSITFNFFLLHKPYANLQQNNNKQRVLYLKLFIQIVFWFIQFNSLHKFYLIGAIYN